MEDLESLMEASERSKLIHIYSFAITMHTTKIYTVGQTGIPQLIENN